MVVEIEKLVVVEEFGGFPAGEEAVPDLEGGICVRRRKKGRSSREEEKDDDGRRERTNRVLSP